MFKFIQKYYDNLFYKSHVLRLNVPPTYYEIDNTMFLLCFKTLCDAVQKHKTQDDIMLQLYDWYINIYPNRKYIFFKSKNLLPYTQIIAKNTNKSIDRTIDDLVNYKIKIENKKIDDIKNIDLKYLNDIVYSYLNYCDVEDEHMFKILSKNLHLLEKYNEDF